MSDTLGIGARYPKADLDFWYEVQKYKVRFVFFSKIIV